ncbi:MAG: FAD-binding protein [Sandaracinaceae bacterium]|nr:FAD-binding protein [Sandaracinaceae bacterium]
MSDVNAADLDRALIEIDRAIGDGRVIRDADVRDAYSHDESETPRTRPDAVIRAQTTQEVSAILASANRHRIPVTPRAAGTGRTGGAVPVAGGILLSLEGMNSVRGIEREDLMMVTGPGVVTGELHRLVEAESLFYPPDPNSLASCQLGGNIAENAGGPRAFKYGVTRDYVLGLEVVIADGTILRLGKNTVKGVTGYDLTSLLVGSEGTLGVVTQATLRLVPLPDAVVTCMVLLPDVATAGRTVSALVARRMVPRCLELLDRNTLDILRPQASLPIDERAGAMLIIELDGPEDSLERQLEQLGNTCEDLGAIEVLVARHGSDRERLWAARRELSRALRRCAKYKLSEDVVVPRSRVPALLDRVALLSENHQVRMPTYGHAGDGNLHVNFLWNDADERPRVDAAIEGLFRAVIEMGGTLSGEHGIGVLKAPFLPIEQSPALIGLQERIKDTFDPNGILNPGKIFPNAAARFHRAC